MSDPPSFPEGFPVPERGLEEVAAAELGEATAPGAAKRGFTAREMTLEVTGVCADCRKA